MVVIDRWSLWNHELLRRKKLVRDLIGQVDVIERAGWTVLLYCKSIALCYLFIAFFLTQKQGMMGGGGAQQQQQARPQDPSSQSAIARLFARFDVTTTSYHLVTSRFDLHLCDDTDTPSGMMSLTQTFCYQFCYLEQYLLSLTCTFRYLFSHLEQNKISCEAVLL